MTTVFISDLHLDDSRPSATAHFIELLKKLNLNKISNLYILGDFLEYWVGDDDPSNCAKEAFNAIKEFGKTSNIFLMHGNRDFLISKEFCEKNNAQLINDPTIININNKKILLMHGDTLCTDDIKYQEYRKIVRNKQWQDEVLKKNLEERLRIADSLRDLSKNEISVKDEFIMDVNNEQVINMFNNHNIDEIIHGHTHRANIHTIKIENNIFRRIVLGDWYNRSFILYYDKDGIKIERNNLN